MQITSSENIQVNPNDKITVELWDADIGSDKGDQAWVKEVTIPNDSKMGGGEEDQTLSDDGGNNNKLEIKIHKVYQNK